MNVGHKPNHVKSLVFLFYYFCYYLYFPMCLSFHLWYQSYRLILSVRFNDSVNFVHFFYFYLFLDSQYILRMVCGFLWFSLSLFHQPENCKFESPSERKKFWLDLLPDRRKKKIKIPADSSPPADLISSPPADLSPDPSSPPSACCP
jgi:hypothetical protein